jgi:hypothetical protein
MVGWWPVITVYYFLAPSDDLGHSYPAIVSLLTPRLVIRECKTGIEMVASSSRLATDGANRVSY